MTLLKDTFRAMALNPRRQLKKLVIGTCGALLCMLLLIATSEYEVNWLFYSLSSILVLFVLYAIPGYIGIWMWRMRKFFFDLD